MIKKLINRFINKFWRKQDKKLSDLQKSVTELQKSVNNLQKNANELQKKLNEQKTANRDLKNYLVKEIERHDYWKVRAAEIKWLAKGKKIWVIKIPTPDTNAKLSWGEYHFAYALKRELENLGYYAVVDLYENWYCEIEADFVLVLKGKRVYHPDRRNEKCKYIMWHVCHPNHASKEEYELYDLVYIDSVPYAEKVRQEVSVPVKPLLVCVDTSIFFPQEKEAEYDIVFVGNTRGERRPFVEWCENNDIPIHIWGRMDGADGWKKFVRKDTCIKLECLIDNKDLPELYRASKVILNDHYGDMREYGFLNNRILEALCCGRPLVSDYSPAFEEIFGDSIVYYHGEEDFIEKLKYLEENYEEQRKKVLDIWPKLQKEFSFAERAKTLAKAAEEL